MVAVIAGVECDLVVRGGTVVTAGSSGECDLGISEGRICQLGGPLRGRREIDAAGALVLPGGLDMHVHLSMPEPPEPGAPGWVDDFAQRLGRRHRRRRDHHRQHDVPRARPVAAAGA